MNFGLFKKDTHSMNIKDLEKISKIYEEIKSIDLEIEKLHKLAQSACNSELEINLNITNIKAKDKFIKNNMINSEGDLNYPGVTDSFTKALYKSMMTGKPVSFKMENKPYEQSHSQLLTDEISLRIFNVLIDERKTEKDKLIAKLSSNYNISI